MGKTLEVNGLEIKETACTGGVRAERKNREVKMENLNKMENVALLKKVLNLEKENEALRKMVHELNEVLRKQQNVASALEFVKSYAVMHPNGPDRHDGRKFFSTVIVDYKPPAFEPVVLDDEATPSKRVPEIKRWQVFIREV